MSKARTLAGVVSTGAVLADGTVDASEIGSLTLPSGGDIVGTTAVQTLTNKTIDIASNTLTGVQASLVSGTNIKTINGATVLGSGDLEVGGGAWTYIANQAITTGTTIYNFTGLGDYDVIRVLVTNTSASNGSYARIFCGLSTGTAAQNPRDDNYGTILVYYESGITTARPSGNTAEYISGYTQADAGKPYHLDTTIQNFGQTAYTTFIVSANHSQSTYYGSNGSGYINYSEPYDYIRVEVGEPTTGGNIIVLGVKQ